VASAPKIVPGADGAYDLVGTIDGLTVTFATVNASRIHELRAEAGLPPVASASTETDAGKEG
jgi:hypothetical protein